MPDQKTFYFRLKTLSPIHIGCGEVYEPMSFVMDDKQMELISFDPKAFLEKLAEEELKIFSKICRKGTTESLVELYKFMDRNKGLAEGNHVACSKHFIDHHKKVQALTGKDMKNGLNQFQINRTAFNLHGDAPYIPGSAIKGAMRTAILNLLRSAAKNERIKSNIRAKELEEYLLGGSFSQDPFSLIKVSDFMPADVAKRRIVYAVNQKKKVSKTEKKGPSPYQILEIIEPGTEFRGSITSLEAPDRRIKNFITLFDIENALSSFYEKERRREESEASIIGCPNKPTCPEAMSLIRLGRHSGAECLTVEGYRNIRIMQGPKPAKFGDRATTLWFASPERNPQDNTKFELFGWAALEEISEGEAKICMEQAAKLRQKRIRSEKNKREENQHIEEEARLRKKAEEEKKARLEEEERHYPWRKYLAALEGIDDWGHLRTEALEHEDLTKYQAEPDVGEAVRKAAMRTRERYPNTWDQERDQQVEDWLRMSGTSWERSKRPDSPPPQNPILQFESWEQYKALGIKIETLPLTGAEALHKRFKKLKWKKAQGLKPLELEKLERHLSSFPK